MTRIIIKTYDDGIARRVGWFDTATAEYWDHPTATSRLWLTPSGRWVYTQTDGCHYLTTDEAREALVSWGLSHVAVGRIDNAPTVGRPEIGPEVKTHLPEAVIAELESMAKAAGISRAELLRRLIVDGVYSPGDMHD